MVRTATEWREISIRINALSSIQEARFVEGLITAFLLFCIGSMTILGALNEGLEGDRKLLMVKSLLDGVSSIAFASSYGWGVLFSIFPMLFFQGGITVLAWQLKPYLNAETIDVLSATGGLLIVGIGINLLGLADIRVENLLPALLVCLLGVYVQKQLGRFQRK